MDTEEVTSTQGVVSSVELDSQEYTPFKALLFLMDHLKGQRVWVSPQHQTQMY